MRVFAARNVLRQLKLSTQQTRSLRHTLLVSSLGLSAMLAMTAAASASSSCSATTAQCDARYSPEYSGDSELYEANAFTLPLDGEKFASFEDSSAKRYSLATYKANSPIEDKYDVQSGANGDIFALVLDGHGGWQVSEYGRKTLISNVKKEIEDLLQDPALKELEESKKTATVSKRIEAAIQSGFARTDRDLMGQVAAAFRLGFGAVARCGSCACLAYVHDKTLFLANAGDIRAVLGKHDPNKADAMLAEPLSHDHNAMSKREQEKLKKEHPNEPNAFVCRHPDSCYVKSALQPTRALGDFALKYAEFNGPPYVNGDRSAGRHFGPPFTPPYISAVPEVKRHALNDNDAFVIIGSDGVWDFLSNEEAVEVVRQQLAQGNQDRAGRALVEAVLQKAAKRYDMTYQELLSLPPGSNRRRRHDDTTAIVVFFD